MSDPYGLRRVVRPQGVLPQQAEVIDPRLPPGPDELLVEVERLNIDAASFRQLREECAGNPARISARVREIVAARGKMQNPVTGSGGMLIGRVASVGPEHPAQGEVRVGDRIATLVSLTLTPLVLEEILAVHLGAERLDVRGRAVLFATGLWAPMPEDLPEALALAVLDVCGAPAWVARLAVRGQRVLVLGAGKSGALACAQARKNGAQVTALDYREEAARRLVEDGLADGWLALDATRPLGGVREDARAVRPGGQLRQRAGHGDGEHPLRARRRRGALLQHGDELHRRGPGRGGRGQGRAAHHRQRLCTRPCPPRPRPGAGDPRAPAHLRGAGGLMPRQACALVLAGGESRRFGSDKALAPFRGATLLEAVLAGLSSLRFAQVAVVAKQPGRYAAFAGAAELLGDASAAQTPLAGLAAGLRAARHEVVFACAADMPFAPDEPLVDALTAAIAGCDAVVPEAGGSLQPLCAMWRRNPCLPAAEELLLGDRPPGPRAILQRVRWTRLPWDDLRPFLDADTPEALSELDSLSAEASRANCPSELYACAEMRTSCFGSAGKTITGTSMRCRSSRALCRGCQKAPRKGGPA